MAVDIKVNGENRYGVNNLYAEKISGGNQKFELPKTLGTKYIDTNGTYLASNDGLDGFSEVEVNVSGGGGSSNPEKFAQDWNEQINTVSIISVLQFNNQSTSLDFTGVDTSDITNMSSMFGGCNSLPILNISNFNTSNVTNMSYMFTSCIALTSLDLSNFNTSNVTDMSGMFMGCSSLSSLDIRNFDFTNVSNYNQMFYNVPSTCTIYVNQAGYNWITTNSVGLADINMLQVV